SSDLAFASRVAEASPRGASASAFSASFASALFSPVSSLFAQATTVAATMLTSTMHVLMRPPRQNGEYARASEARPWPGPRRLGVHSHASSPGVGAQSRPTRAPVQDTRTVSKDSKKSLCAGPTRGTSEDTPDDVGQDVPEGEPEGSGLDGAHGVVAERRKGGEASQNPRGQRQADHGRQHRRLEGGRHQHAHQQGADEIHGERAVRERQPEGPKRPVGDEVPHTAADGAAHANPEKLLHFEFPLLVRFVQQAADLRQELERAERLSKEREVEVSLNGGYRDDRNVPQSGDRAQAVDQLEAVHLRHHHVRHDQVGWVLDGLTQGIPPVERHDDAVAVELQEGLQDLTDVGLVVHDENRSHRRIPRPLRPAPLGTNDPSETTQHGLSTLERFGDPKPVLRDRELAQ